MKDFVFHLTLLYFKKFNFGHSSKYVKWKWSLSVVSDSLRPHELAYQAPLSS